MRATDIQLKNPKDKTPFAYEAYITSSGHKMFVQGYKADKPAFLYADRFPEYKRLAKKTGFLVSPGSYNHDITSISRKRIKGTLFYKKRHNRVDTSDNTYYMAGNHLVFDPCLNRKRSRLLKSQQRHRF